MDTVRSFIAVPLTQEVRRSVAALRREVSAGLPGVRWAKPETLHLTLRFLGEVPEESLEKIGEAMLSVGGFHPPFQAEIAGFGAFPSPARPRVFWLGIHGPPLLALQADLEMALADVGIPRDDRPFSPHLTLGRTRDRRIDARTTVERYREAFCCGLPVDRIVLYESRLRPSGAQHLPRRTVELGR